MNIPEEVVSASSFPAVSLKKTRKFPLISQTTFFTHQPQISSKMLLRFKACTSMLLSWWWKVLCSGVVARYPDVLPLLTRSPYKMRQKYNCRGYPHFHAHAHAHAHAHTHAHAHVHAHAFVLRPWLSKELISCRGSATVSSVRLLQSRCK